MIIYFSGDSGNIVSNITWTSWTAHSAVGRGTWQYNNCNPDCAEGRLTPYRTAITLSRPFAGQFTRLTESQSGPRAKTYTHQLPDPGLNAAS